MQNETRTPTDCEQGLHRWSRLYKRSKNGHAKQMCSKCGQVAVMEAGQWVLVPRVG